MRTQCNVKSHSLMMTLLIRCWRHHWACSEDIRR